jgi:hypothetical protein
VRIQDGGGVRGHARHRATGPGEPLGRSPKAPAQLTTHLLAAASLLRRSATSSVRVLVL